MNRVGALLVFRPGTSKAAASAALETLRPLLDPTYFGSYDADLITRVPVLARVEEFDDAEGGPTWYIP